MNDEFLDNMDDDLHICDPPLNNENELNKSKLSESIEEIRSVVCNAGTISPSLSETNTRILVIETSIKSISSICSDINDKLSIVIQNSTMNSSAIESLDCKVNQLDKDLKTYVDSQFKGINERIDKIPPPGMDNQPLHIQTSSIEMLRREVKSIKSKQKRDELTISYISDTIADVKDQLDQSLDKSVDGGLGIDNSHELTPPLPEITLVHSGVNPREIPRNSPSNSRTNKRDLIKDSVESTAKLIRQLINTKISEHTDFNLIKKCNNDVKKVTAYVKSSQDALMKYISYDNYDQDYVDPIKELLNRTNKWILQTSPEFPKDPQRSPEFPRVPQSSPEFPRDPQRSPEIPRDPQSSPEIPRDPQKIASRLM